MRGLFYVMLFVLIYSASLFGAGVAYDRIYYRPIMEKEYCETISKGGTFRCEDNWIAKVVPSVAHFKIRIQAEEAENGRTE